jgi:hypothetical protein
MTQVELEMPSLIVRNGSMTEISQAYTSLIKFFIIFKRDSA